MLYRKSRQTQRQHPVGRSFEKVNDRPQHISNQSIHHIKSKYNQALSLDNTISSIQEVPPLFDRSIDSIIFNSPQQTHRTNLNSTFEFSKQGRQKYTDSIYIKDEDPDAKQNRPLEGKIHLDKKDPFSIEIIKQRKIGENNILQEWSTGKANFNQNKSKFQYLTIQLYNEIVENAKKLNDSQQKPAKEILAGLLTNSSKMQKFVKNNIEDQINIKYLREMKQKMEISEHKKDQQLNKFKYRKEVENLQILVCLLAKIQEGSILCGGELPEINIEKGGQINISFGNSRDKYRNIKMLGKFSKSIKSDKYRSKQAHEDGTKTKSEQMRNSQRIRELQNNLEQKQKIMQQVHKGYEVIIQNYAESIQNILKKTRERLTTATVRIPQKSSGKKLKKVEEKRNLEQQSSQNQMNIN